MKPKTAAAKTAPLAPSPTSPVDVHPGALALRSFAKQLAERDLATCPLYNLDAVHASSVAVATAQRIAPYMARLAKLPEYDLRHAQQLAALGDALFYVDSVIAAREAPANDHADNVASAIKLRDLLLANATTLVLAAVFDAAVIEGIKRRFSHNNLVGDLGALVALYQQHPEVMGDGAIVTRAHLAEGLRLAERIRLELGRRAGSQSDETTESLMIERRKLAAMLLEANDQVRRGIAFFRHDEGDAKSFVPSVHVVGARGGAKSDKPENGEKNEKNEKSDGADATAPRAKAERSAIKSPAFAPVDPRDNPFEDGQG